MAGRARVALFKSIGTLLEVVPESLDVAVASALAASMGRLRPSTRRHLDVNLAHALAPVGDVVEPELLDRFASRALRSYGRYWAEGAKLPSIPRERVVRRFVIAEGMEHLEEAKARGKGLVVALPHVGSWEWGGSYLDSLGMGMTAVAELLDPPELFEWFKQKRESIGIKVQPLDEHAGTVLVTTLREGGVAGLLCDRDLQDNGVEVTFFGERVTLPGGPATLALRTGATLVAAACYSGPGKDHHAVVTAPIDAQRSGRLREDVTRVTQLVAIELEGLIRRAPEQWHVLQPRFEPS